MRYQSPAAPTSHLVRRVAQGASTREMMRRGEIAGQALGLLQLVAAHDQAPQPLDDDR
ncbi:MAG: hypothetical protein HRU13_04060, partial [Phycisphaerales bacterium]|nr:hypothetical protein [Phycisphaerales bacterium]